MIARTDLDLDLKTQIDAMLRMMGPERSHTDSGAYDTAWIARLAPHYRGRGFGEASAWLRDHQRRDGSWGGAILHYHDRIISTLAAIIALREVGEGYEDEQRIRAGETFLWRENGRLSYDAHDTIAFPVLALALVNEASAMDLDVPVDLFQNADKIEKKLNLLAPNPALWRYTSLIFSFEAMRAHVPQPIDFDFSEENGSVGTSPSATVAAILASRSANPTSLDYLQRVVEEQGDGGGVFIHPFDIFEIAWTLNHLRQVGVIQPDDPEVRRLLNFLWSRWSPEQGITFSTYFHVHDLDDTAVIFSLLRWGGYPAHASVFDAYEEDTHFRCYPGELDLSLSVNIRTLAAMRMDAGYIDYGRWSEKIIKLLRRFDLNGYFWFDKWHASPYYLTATAVWSLQGVADDLLVRRIRWIEKTQHEDGGWGYYGESTAEETAYCLEALLYWDERVERIDPMAIHAAAYFLMQHAGDTRYPKLWIGKSLYNPVYLVKSAILGALYSYQRYMEE